MEKEALEASKKELQNVSHSIDNILRKDESTSSTNVNSIVVNVPEMLPSLLEGNIVKIENNDIDNTQHELKTDQLSEEEIIQRYNIQDITYDEPDQMETYSNFEVKLLPLLYKYNPNVDLMILLSLINVKWNSFVNRNPDNNETITGA